MRLPGWCEQCRKIKLVRVTNTMSLIPGSVVVGVCAQCEDERT